MDELERFYREHLPTATRLAFLLVGPSAQLDDLVQDALLRCAAKVHSLSAPEKVGPYLHRTIARAAIDRSRSDERRRRREGVVGRASASVDPGPASAVALRVDVRDALDALPPEQRAAVILRYWLDYSEREIAAVLRCRPGTVKSRLSRAIDVLRVALDDIDGRAATDVPRELR